MTTPTDNNDNNSNSNSNAKCDVCGYGDGHNTLVLIQCTDCQLFVHRDCYGMPTFTERNFQCWACQATGRTFYVHQEQKGTRQMLAITQTTRPAFCDLCGYNNTDEIHAMHPVYDNYGNKARQLYTCTTVDDKHQYRLVWAHTICGFFLATRTLLYATSREGTTHEGEESDSEDDRSVNPELDDQEQNSDNDNDDKFQGFAPTHHFVWHTEPKWTKVIRDHQMALTCEICKMDDYAGGNNKDNNKIYRIAVQCSANDKSEYKLFRPTHTKSLQDDQTCTLAFHVGCARWGATTLKNLRRVYYFPGLPNDETLDTIQCIYCPLHAQDVNAKQSQQRQVEEETQQQLARNKRKRAMITKAAAPLTLDQYDVHQSTSDQLQQQTLPLLERMKQDLAQKVLAVTRENSNAFIKEQKRLWKRLAMAEDEVDDDEFQTLWRQAKAHANQVWLDHQQEQQPKAK